MAKKIGRIFLFGIISVLIFAITGCGSQAASNATESQETTTEETTTHDLSEPNPIGLYLKHREQGTYELITQYTGDWEVGKDIKSFEAFASDEALISGDTYGNLWKARWNDHPDAATSKIGYCLTIELKDGESLVETMKRPSDTVGDFNEYVEVWIYDDIYNLGASWYSHLTEDDFYDTSLMSSIKLTAAEKIDEIKDLKLKAFIYDSEEDFNFDTGEYIGQNSYEITISRTN